MFVVFPSYRRHIYNLPTINKGTDRYLGYDDMQTAKNVSELQRHATYTLSWKEAQQARPQRWHNYIILHGVTSQTTALFTAITTKTLYAQLVYSELADSITAITEHFWYPTLTETTVTKRNIHHLYTCTSIVVTGIAWSCLQRYQERQVKRAERH